MEKKVVIEKLDSKVKIHIINVTMEELAVMCGAIQETAGNEFVKRGKTLDEVKDGLLDIHLAAMEQLTGKYPDERREGWQGKD